MSGGEDKFALASACFLGVTTLGVSIARRGLLVKRESNGSDKGDTNKSVEEDHEIVFEDKAASEEVQHHDIPIMTHQHNEDEEAIDELVKSLQEKTKTFENVQDELDEYQHAKDAEIKALQEEKEQRVAVLTQTLDDKNKSLQAEIEQVTMKFHEATQKKDVEIQMLQEEKDRSLNLLESQIKALQDENKRLRQVEAQFEEHKQTTSAELQTLKDEKEQPMSELKKELTEQKENELDVERKRLSDLQVEFDEYKRNKDQEFHTIRTEHEQMMANLCETSSREGGKDKDRLAQLQGEFDEYKRAKEEEIRKLAEAQKPIVEVQKPTQVDSGTPPPAPPSEESVEKPTEALKNDAPRTPSRHSNDRSAPDTPSTPSRQDSPASSSTSSPSRQRRLFGPSSKGASSIIKNVNKMSTPPPASPGGNIKKRSSFFSRFRRSSKNEISNI
mmetsp:Transcript_16036/g.44151  ORF Transcript_16036/g.44151 Transcript_16036/m.44151 type:complete len:444 (+) Transcript_16036:82-1413(+)|eukprot:CAMPEP_0168727544 /NCGR_PEP_ID=MMETSP0724-20121128/5231_1 /TAXON_ID=265536 /ORGANISM="Amphiprora sp., Strain CCMP467" /LENGTH=443 /DNA_ID=CAMNT_0008774377 /DNA_START=60 /DNA_END=1391 /DNA_ORIENTATION=+